MALINLASLNVGRFFHRAPEAARRFLLDPQWDVICVQDIIEDAISVGVPGLEFSRRWPAQHFVPMCKHLIRGRRVPVGIGIFSRYPFRSTSAHAYVGQVQPVLDLDGVTIDAHGNAAPHDLDRVRATESRLVIFADILVDDEVFRIGTTHGTWVPGGKADDHQRRSMSRLKSTIEEQNAFVVAGDFNAARGGEIYRALAHGLIDCVPESYTNSVDWENRGKKGPDLLVDHIFTDRFATHGVHDVAFHFGVSDHAAVSATVVKGG